MITLTFIAGLVLGFVLCLICNKRIYDYFTDIQSGIDDIKKVLEELEILDEQAICELLEEARKTTKH